MAAIWSNVEMNIALTCSCLPTIRVLFPRLFRSQVSISLSRSGEDSGGRTPKFPTVRISTRPRGSSTTALRPYRSSNHEVTGKSASSLEAFGKSLDGQEKGLRRAKQKSSYTRNDNGSFDFEMKDYEMSQGLPLEGNQVVTTL